MVAAEAEGARGKTRGWDDLALEEGRGEVVAAETEVEVQKVGDPGVDVGLDPLFLLEKDVQGPVALVEGRWRDTVGKHDVVEPLEDRPALGGRREQAVGEHDEHGGGEVLRAPGSADRREELIEVEARAAGVDRRDTTEPRRAVGDERSRVDPTAGRMARERGDDAVELTRTGKVGDLAKAEQRLMGVLPVDAHGLDQREIRIAPVAPSTNRRLHEHADHIMASTIQCRGCVAPALADGYVPFRTGGPGQDVADLENGPRVAELGTETSRPETSRKGRK